MSSGSKLFDTLMVLQKEYLEKKLILKKNQDAKLSSRQVGVC